MALLGHPELYGNTSTETGQIRNCCDWESVTASQVRLPDKLWKICQHSIALIDLNSINGTSIVKLVYLSSGLQTDEAWIQAFCTTTLWCCYFSILLIHLLQSDVIVKSTLTAVRCWNEILSAIFQELSDALIQVLGEIPLETIHRLIRSMSRYCQEQALRSHTHYCVILWVAMIKFTEVGSVSPAAP